MKDSDQQACRITSLFLWASANIVPISQAQLFLDCEISEEANPRGNSTARFPVHLPNSPVEEFYCGLGEMAASA